MNQQNMNMNQPQLGPGMTSFGPPDFQGTPDNNMFGPSPVGPRLPNVPPPRLPNVHVPPPNSMNNMPPNMNPCRPNSGPSSSGMVPFGHSLGPQDPGGNMRNVDVSAGGMTSQNILRCMPQINQDDNVAPLSSMCQPPNPQPQFGMEHLSNVMPQLDLESNELGEHGTRWQNWGRRERSRSRDRSPHSNTQLDLKSNELGEHGTRWQNWGRRERSRSRDRSPHSNSSRFYSHFTHTKEQISSFRRSSPTIGFQSGRDHQRRSRRSVSPRRQQLEDRRRPRERRRDVSDYKSSRFELYLIMYHKFCCSKNDSFISSEPKIQQKNLLPGFRCFATPWQSTKRFEKI